MNRYIFDDDDTEIDGDDMEFDPDQEDMYDNEDMLEEEYIDYPPEDEETEPEDIGNKDVALRRKHHKPSHLTSIDILRLLLVMILCVNYFGFPGKYGVFVQIYSAFSSVAFFMISGFLVLGDDDNISKRILNTIKKSTITLGIVIPLYFAVNVLYYVFIKGTDIFSVLTKTSILKFLVLNIWPLQIGGTIWYVQAILYAYIIIYFLKKFKLLKYDWIIFIGLMLFMILSGELSLVIKFNVFGFNHISGNFLTRALPYILAGRIMKRYERFLSKVHWFIYVAIIIFGIILIQFELNLLLENHLLGYTGHFIGMAVVAAAVSLPFLTGIVKKFEFAPKIIKNLYTYLYKICFFLFHPVGYYLDVAMTYYLPEEFIELIKPLFGLITFAITILISMLIVHISRVASVHIRMAKEFIQRKKERS